MLLALSPAIVLVSQEPTAVKTISVKYTLRYYSPSEIVVFLDDPGIVAALQAEGRLTTKAPRVLRPEGIHEIQLNDADNSMVVQATPAAHAALKQLLTILDTELKQVLLKLRFLRDGQLVMEPYISTSNHSKSSITLGDKTNPESITVTPHLSQDGKSIRLELVLNKEKPVFQTLKLGVETKLIFPNNQVVFVRATLP
nr:hypothetical protein [Armatimonas sp.]